jgi:hypothetical protein
MTFLNQLSANIRHITEVPIIDCFIHLKQLVKLRKLKIPLLRLVLMALGSTQPLTEMSTRNVSWG